MSETKVVQLDVDGWVGTAENAHALVPTRVIVLVEPNPDGTLFTIVPHRGDGVPDVEARAMLPPAAARKLRRLATFHRDQHRFPAEMDVEDELRAAAAIAKTLDSMDPDARSRVLEWVRSRHASAELKALNTPEAYAKKRVLG